MALRILSACLLPSLLFSHAHAIPTTSSDTPSSIKWQNYTAALSPGIDYGELQVPIDWNDPTGEQVTLGMLRHKTTATGANRIGSLFFNPGGPGLPASSIVAAATYSFSQELLDHFDIIGLDPRGVGLSSPIQCDPDLFNKRVPIYPSTEAEFEEKMTTSKLLGESCRNLTGPLLEHLDSVSVAKDLEAVRAALGDGKLNYLGLSYGTLIGAQYAELFPDNFRALAFDGNLDHNEDEISLLFTSSSAYEIELIGFSAWCAQNTTCALHGTDVLQLVDDLVAKAETEPIPAPGCNGTCRTDVTGEELLLNINSGLAFKEPAAAYGLPGWGDLAAALAEASAGNATALSTALAIDSSSPVFPTTAITCLDWIRGNKSLADIKYRQQLTAALTPHTKGVSGMSLVQTQCANWPIPVKNKEHNADIHDTTEILLVNAQYDPASSYVWANGLLGQIGDATLLTRKGDGHTSYFLFGETAKAIDSYLVNLTVPAPNTVLDS